MKDKSDLIAILILIVIVVCLALIGGHYIEKATDLERDLFAMQDSVQTLNVILSDAGVIDYVPPASSFSWKWFIACWGCAIIGFLCASIIASGRDD